MRLLLRFPHGTLEWDGARMRFPKRPEVDAFLHARNRKGWGRRECWAGSTVAEAQGRNDHAPAGAGAFDEACSRGRDQGA